MKSWILGALLAAAPGLAMAQELDQYQQEVLDQLLNAATTVGEEGWSLSHDVIEGALRQEEIDSAEIDLTGGVEYMIIGVCDSDCSDIDLVVGDADGNVLGSDTEADDVPIVLFTPPRNGTYLVVTSMYACASQPCRYGAAAFTQE